MFVVSRPPSQRRSCSIQQQQNPDTPIAIHRSLADSQHACADALIVRTYVDPAAHSRLRTRRSAERIQQTHPLSSDPYNSTAVPYTCISQCSQMSNHQIRRSALADQIAGVERKGAPVNSTDFTTLPPTRRLSSSLPVKVVANRP